MEPKKIIASIKVSVQIGPDDWTCGFRTAVFPQEATLLDVLTWARRHGDYQPHDISLSFAE